MYNNNENQPHMSILDSLFRCSVLIPGVVDIREMGTRCSLNSPLWKGHGDDAMLQKGIFQLILWLL